MRTPLTKIFISLFAVVITLIGAIINSEVLICTGIILILIRLYTSLDLQ